MEPEIFRLKLLAPLFYERETAPEPFAGPEEPGDDSAIEKLYCFELEEALCAEFEPDRRKFLCALVFGGRTAGRGQDEPIERPFPLGTFPKETTLPAGDYLFAQKREVLSRDRIIDMAVEIHQEGLWQRLKLGKLLYLRYLYEDNSWVTQLYRPYSE